MISVEEAHKAILDPIRRLEPETVDVLETLGRVLAQDVVADMDIAPFDNSAMDGYAVHAADVEGASEETPVGLDVVEHVRAGVVPERIVGPGEATRIMTGAPIPEGADAVVMVEYTRETQGGGDLGGVAVEQPVRPGENLRLRGEDVREGDVVLRAGEVAGAAAVGLMAAMGHARVSVYHRPRVAIVSTGDELVPISAKPGPGQIRNSNAWSLSAQVRDAGAVPCRLGIVKDTEEETRAVLGRAPEFDAMIATGGVSMGDFDVVREVLESFGGLSFWKVAMRPGAPLTFGLIGGTPFFGLPGNPTSSMVSFELFARPALRVMQGFTVLDRPRVTATLAHDVKKKPHRRYYLRGRLEGDGRGGFEAALSGGQSSALLTSMHLANCLIVLPEGDAMFPQGTEVTCIRLDTQEGTP